MIAPSEHYSRSEVQREIYDFCRGRWVALHYVDSSGNLIFRRYLRGKPIKMRDPDDLTRLGADSLRSVYATANVYDRLQVVEDVYDPLNIAYCTPTWDIDSNLSRWKETLAVAKEIIHFLNDWGVEKSIYIKWSGNGCHVHINERGISEDILRDHNQGRNPLDLAYAITEYTVSKLSLKILELSSNGRIKVENKMDPTRVFTCPLSLHRELDAVCVCMKPEEVDEFTPEWISPQNFRHNPRWREFREGEVDRLAEAAHAAIGGYPLKFRRRSGRTKPLDKQILEWLKKFENDGI
ncbi:hypothetical protein KEJ34_08385 [Candidatus Bathyarchaeota archaeon]|nr:hypothetical protein [Candidatus Bathyarchaeota archaeon]